MQAIMMHTPPSGAQMLQLSLQQNSPGLHQLRPHGSLTHSSFEHRMSSGMQMPPQFGQHFVPCRQRTVAQGSFTFRTQMPEQSHPRLAGSQSSRGSSTQMKPGGHGMPAIPPHIAAGSGSQN